MTAQGSLPLICPVCRAELSGTGPLVCASCLRSYPFVFGIPLLLPDAEKVRSDWAERLGTFAVESEASTKELLKEAVEEGLLDRSRRRLIDTARAIEARKAQVLGLFGRAGILPSSSVRRRENGESVLSYIALIHRDFSWAPEVEEARASLHALLSVLPPGFSLGRTLVLGAGTGRLAWDLGHELSERAPIVLIDINPLPFLVGESLRRGETVELFEIPGHPRRSDGVAIERALSADTPPPAGLRYLFADGLEPPFPPETFDTILTPWFMDQVPPNLATLLPKLHRLLRPGGSYLQHGPFVYSPQLTRPAHRYTADEFVQLLLQNGFEVGKASYEPMMYLGSPVSTQSRNEHVLTLHAWRPHERDKTLAAVAEPLWVSDENLKVPTFTLSPTFLVPHAVIRRALELVDGSRSLADIAASLVKEGQLADDGTAIVAVRACLKVLWRARVPSGS